MEKFGLVRKESLATLVFASAVVLLTSGDLLAAPKVKMPGQSSPVNSTRG